MKDVLAEDYVLGVLVPSRLGKRVVIASRPVESVSCNRSVSGFVARYARWAVLQRQAVGLATYAAQIVLNPILVAAVALAAAPEPVAFAASAVTCAMKALVDELAARRVPPERIPSRAARGGAAQGLPLRRRMGLRTRATGIAALDRNTLGLQPGSLVILAARPSVGKTAFALNAATHAATRHDKKVAFFSLEMPSEQLALRILASEAKLDWRRLSQGMLSSYDWQKIAVQGDRISRANVWLDDNFVLRPVELRSKCRKLKRENGGLDLVVVDYLQLMHSPSDRASQSREQEIATISRSLKALAKELECPVLALSQLNRGVEKRKGERPMLSDLRESGAIEQDADVVLFLHRGEEQEGKDAQTPTDVQEFELIVAKQRQGPTGTIPLVFVRSTTLFVEMEKRREPS